MPHFTSGGFDLAYDDITPDGPTRGTIVLAHGFAANRAETWRRLGWYGAFERRGWRAVGLDLRGHGESAAPHDPAAYDRAQMSADLVLLMDHLGIVRADLMGYSLGAHLAAIAAAATPDRFDRLILGGVGARSLEPAPLGSGAMTLAEAMTAPEAEAIDDAILKGFRRYADLEGSDRLALAACSQGAGPRLVDSLDMIAAPSLVVTGALDKIAGDPAAVASRLANARAVSVPGCDHFSATPHALVKAAVFDFLEGWEEDWPH